MWPLLQAEIAAAIVGICAVLLHLTGPDVPPPRSADPVVSRQQQQAAKRATWREFQRERKGSARASIRKPLR